MIELVEVTARFFEGGDTVTFARMDKFWWQNSAWKFFDPEINHPEEALVEDKDGEIFQCNAWGLSFRFIANSRMYSPEAHNWLEYELIDRGIREIEDWTAFSGLLAIAERHRVMDTSPDGIRVYSFIAAFDSWPSQNYYEGEPDGVDVEVEFLGELDLEKVRGAIKAVKA